MGRARARGASSSSSSSSAVSARARLCEKLELVSTYFGTARGHEPNLCNDESGESAYMAGNGHQKQRLQNAQQWLCKWCTHPKTGERWWNHADKKECGSCGQPKGLVFFGPREKPAGSAPSVSAKQLSLERKAAADAERAKVALQEKNREIAKLKEQLAAKNGPDDMETDEVAEPDAQAALAELAAAIQAIGSPKDPVLARHKQEMLQQQATLRAKVLADKPIGAKLHLLTNRCSALEKKRERQQAAANKLKEKLAEVQKQVADAEAAVAETAKELLEAEAARRLAASQAPQPEHGVHSLRAAIPCIDMDVGALGKLLDGLGADGALAQSVAANFEELRRLEREAAERAAGGAAPAGAGARGPGRQSQQQPPQRAEPPGPAEAAPPPAQPADSDDLPDLRNFWKQAFDGDPPEDETQLRAAIKRLGGALGTYQKKKARTDE